MSVENYSYDVTCRTCRKKFTVQLFDSHEKNLFLVDKKHWYCDTCKTAYFQQQTAERVKDQQAIGFPALDGSEKMISWAVKIRAELMNKLDYLKKSLTFESDDDRAISDKAFAMLMDDWRKKTDAKWWIDNRNMNIRDMSNQLSKIKESL